MGILLNVFHFSGIFYSWNHFKVILLYLITFFFLPHPHLPTVLNCSNPYFSFASSYFIIGVLLNELDHNHLIITFFLLTSPPPTSSLCKIIVTSQIFHSLPVTHTALWESSWLPLTITSTFFESPSKAQAGNLWHTESIQNGPSGTTLRYWRKTRPTHTFHTWWQGCWIHVEDPKAVFQLALM